MRRAPAGCGETGRGARIGAGTPAPAVTMIQAVVQRVPAGAQWRDA